MDTTQEQVVAIVSAITKAPAHTIGLDTDLRLDLNVDSLQGLQIVAALEKHFAVDVPDEDIDSYTSVRSILDTLGRLQRLP